MKLGPPQSLGPVKMAFYGIIGTPNTFKTIASHADTHRIVIGSVLCVVYYGSVVGHVLFYLDDF